MDINIPFYNQSHHYLKVFAMSVLVAFSTEGKID